MMRHTPLFQMLRLVVLVALLVLNLLVLLRGRHQSQQLGRLEALAQTLSVQRDAALTLVETWRHIAIHERQRCGTREQPL